MNKRTNFSEKLFEYTVKSIIPVFIVLLLLTTNNTGVLKKAILNIGMFLSYPSETISYYKSQNNELKEDEIIASMGEVQSSSQAVTIKSDIPDDIQKLINEAETKYASSTNDGKILAEDYSRKNATAEYDKILLRNTTIDKTIDIGNYINRNVVANVSKSQPAVLIYHTHTSESYELLDRDFYTKARDIRSDNKNETVVRIGEEICKILNEKGYKTIHITDTFDEQYSGAYERSRAKVSEVLKNNPSIQVALDVHRDSIYQKDGTRIKTVTEINDKKVAQIMITTGCETGNVTDFPNWEKNLTFALKLQNQLANDNPQIVRPLIFSSRKYNMDLLPCALSVDIGTDANTLTEAVFSARYFAESLAKLLKEFEN